MSARDELAKHLADLWPVSTGDLREADAILSALSAMPLASRLALARALVPGWAVVPREATEAMLVAGAARHRDFLSNQGPYPRTRAVWTAMLTAAEKPPHGP